MGKPDATMTEQTTSLLLSLLSPAAQVKGGELIASGLHRLVLQQYFDSISPHIKDFVGWKALHEYTIAPYWRETSVDDVKTGKKLTAAWLGHLEELAIADEKAIQIYNGERLSMPAPDLQLFVLRDGRLLYCKAGFHSDSWKRVPTVGSVLEVLDAMGNGYGGSMFSASQYSFLIIMRALNDALNTAIKDRERKLAEHQQLHEKLVQLTGRIR